MTHETRRSMPRIDLRRGSRVGLETARGVTVDDTGARHQAVNGVTTQILELPRLREARFGGREARPATTISPGSPPRAQIAG
jgi:hypothetical protein